MQKIYKAKTIKNFLFAFILFAAGTTNAQVGIGTTTPNPSAQLDVNSTSKGFLPPRMTRAQRNAIPSPAAGLIIWCKDCGAVGEIEVFNGGIWTNMAGGLPIAPIPATVTIGTQVWMTRNLDVVTYRNGDTIPEVKDPAKWASLNTGAWCYYNNDPALGAIYGKLYNHYALVDPRGLAPDGWHVARGSDPDFYNGPDPYYDPRTKHEWDTLMNYLGGSSSKIRATTLWNTPNAGISNESGFTGLPAGQRNMDGSFSLIGEKSTWWTPDSNYRAWQGTFKYYDPFVLGLNGIESNQILVEDICGQISCPWLPNGDIIIPAGRYGFSVRCIKD